MKKLKVYSNKKMPDLSKSEVKVIQDFQTDKPRAIIRKTSENMLLDFESSSRPVNYSYKVKSDRASGHTNQMSDCYLPPIKTRSAKVVIPTRSKAIISIDPKYMQYTSTIEAMDEIRLEKERMVRSLERTNEVLKEKYNIQLDKVP